MSFFNSIQGAVNNMIPFDVRNRKLESRKYFRIFSQRQVYSLQSAFCLLKEYNVHAQLFKIKSRFG